MLSIQGVQVQSLVGKLRSHMPRDEKTSRNKQFISFTLQAVLSSVMRSQAVLFSTTWDVNHPFVQQILPTSHLVATQLLDSLSLTGVIYVQVTLILLNNGLKV